MSTRLTAWAWEQDIRPSTRKFVLIALAMEASNDALVYPEVDKLQRQTSQDRKTIVVALNALEARGVLTRTGTLVYRINMGDGGK